MKKSTRAPAPGIAKPRKVLSSRATAPRRLTAVDGEKATIRRLRRELAQARKQVEELQASAEMDFLLGVYNRRGFQRELERAIAYIKRYHGSGALVDRKSVV